jgi:hypothetical protein
MRIFPTIGELDVLRFLQPLKRFEAASFRLFGAAEPASHVVVAGIDGRDQI